MNGERKTMNLVVVPRCINACNRIEIKSNSVLHDNFFFISIIFLSVNFIGRTHGVMNKFPDRQKNRIDDENESVNYKNKFISYCEISQILLFILALSLAPL